MWIHFFAKIGYKFLMMLEMYILFMSMCNITSESMEFISSSFKTVTACTLLERVRKVISITVMPFVHIDVLAFFIIGFFL